MFTALWTGWWRESRIRNVLSSGKVRSTRGAMRYARTADSRLGNIMGNIAPTVDVEKIASDVGWRRRWRKGRPRESISRLATRERSFKRCIRTFS